MKSAFVAHAVSLVFATTLTLYPASGAAEPSPSATNPPTFPPTLKAFPLGQPPYYRFEWGTLAGYGFRAERPTYRFLLDMEGRVAAPQFGLIDVAFEGTYMRRGEGSGGTFGASLKLPILRGGFEYDLHASKPFIKLSLQGAPRRGGILGRGDRVRIDYIPARRSLEAGMKMPFPWADYRATRPRNAHVAMARGRLPRPVPPEPALWPAVDVARVRHSMEWMDRLLTPNMTPRGATSRKGREAFEREAAALREHVVQPGHSFAAEDSSYHACLAEAFALAAGGDAAIGEALAARARAILLRKVILPYNRLLGRIKRPGELTGLLEGACAEFGASLSQPEARLGATERDAAREVFRQVLEQLDEVARSAHRRWRTWRLVWLPLNYGLRPDEYDSQAELDSVLGAVVGQPFSSANTVRYVLNEQFFRELRRSILETRSHHVLWVHDYSGRNDAKGPDRIAWALAVDGYIEAFIRAVRAMDRGERSDLPEFLILLDEHYYRTNGSQEVLSFLENLGSTKAPHLSDANLESRVRSGVVRLRETLEQSSAMRSRGERYLRRRVRVQVAITHPYDPTFMDDMLMRDHTKLAFRDVFEENPASGEAIFTGLGVGEHYVGPQWEDRSLVLRGTELVRLKTAARSLLVTQGIHPDELPGFLREGPFPATYARTCDSLRSAGWTANVLAVMNGTGFRMKTATVLKAALYNLMQRGAVLLAPDSLWTSDFWAGMFVSAALRGCHAFPIAPARENAPSSALPTMGLMHQTLWVLLRSSELLGDAIRAAGGTLRVGLYTNDRDVNDVCALVERMLEKECRDTPLRDRFHIHPSVVQVLREEYSRMQETHTAPVDEISVANPHKPHMHLKAQFFANEAALSLLAREEWAGVLSRYLEARRHQSLGAAVDSDAIGRSLIPDSVSCTRRGGAIVISTLGSHNQDRRSMFLDGEALTAVSGDDCLPAMIDFAFLMGTATWPVNAKELDVYFPEPTGLLRNLGRFLRDLI
ncbi:MAG: hypothetical protein E6K76_04850 [Candidatus Eisenbacteria bacterium]|uniref:Uncharacterized protein n=1 Tax=Eiseniibacteriota bacterium TaxID=2212470 RepID=A0A538T711_UNCEI|nr:MAG: hypothetical protein E6K76_04850 [Candidatus Eisenbacteria bacterium]